MSPHEPLVSPANELPRSFFVTAIYGAFAAVWWPGFYEFDRLFVGILLASFVLLGTRFAGRSGTLLSCGILCCFALILKDFWPASPQFLKDWILTTGVSEPDLNHIRNPQLVNLLKQSGYLAALTVGFAAVHAAWAWGAISRMTWLVFLVVLLAGWNCTVLLQTTTLETYGPGNMVYGIASKNSAATLCAIGAVLSLGVVLSKRQYNGLVIFFVGVFGFMTSIWALSGLRSWTGILGLLIGALVLFCGNFGRYSRGLGRWVWPISSAAVLLLLLVAFSPFLTVRLGSLFGDYRILIWRDTLSLFLPRPFFGIGLGSFESIYPLVGALELGFDKRLTHPDSSWILLILEWGIIPVSCGIVILFNTLPRLFYPRTTTGDYDSATLITIWAGILTWFGCAISDIAFHRWESALIGVSLLALLPELSPKVRSVRLWVPVAALIGAICVVAVSNYARLHQQRSETVDGFSVHDLDLDPFNPRLHVLAANLAGGQSGDVQKAIRHYRAAVLLEHRSVVLPEQIARILTPTYAAEAHYFWTQALARSRIDPAMSFGILERAMAEFRTEPLSYWDGITREGNPSLLVGIASRAGADSSRVLREWIRLGGLSRPMDRAMTDAFFQALASAADTKILPEVLAASDLGLSRDFFVRASRYFYTTGQYSLARNLILGMEPVLSHFKSRSQPVLDAKFRARQIMVLDVDGDRYRDTRRRLLEDACKQEGVPVWFRLELSQLLWAEGHLAESTKQLLQCLERDGV